MSIVGTELAKGVLAEAERLGLARATVEYYRSRCRAVARFLEDRGCERLTAKAVEEFVALQRERVSRGQITAATCSTLEKTVRMMLEFQQSGTIDWQRRRPATDASASDEAVMAGFATSVRGDLAAGSVRLLLGEVHQFFRFLDDAGRCLGEVTVDDVREFLVEARPRHTSGMGSTVWALKRFFRFANQLGLVGLRVEELLAKVGPRRTRVLPCFTPEETGRILTAIETDSPRGKRDYAMVVLALSTGLRGGDIATLRLDGIDWRHDEIRLVQHKTSASLTLPLLAEAGNAIADWLFNGRPTCQSPEVFVRLYAPFVKLTGPTGALIMTRWLAKANISHQAHDGKTFHALRRTTATRLVESGAELALTAQVLGHANVESSRRYIALADASLRDCCLPLRDFPTTREGLR